MNVNFNLLRRTAWTLVPAIVLPCVSCGAGSPGQVPQVDQATAIQWKDIPEPVAVMKTASCEPGDWRGEVGSPPPPKYWIGIICAEIDDMLVKSQLDIPCGVKVLEVVNSHPRQKRGSRNTTSSWKSTASRWNTFPCWAWPRTPLSRTASHSR